MSDNQQAARECAACKRRGKTWTGDDPRCAFAHGAWDDGWSCATDGLIRDLVYEGQNLPHGITYQYCDDQKYACVNVSHIKLATGHALTLWVTWYKNRGATDQMWLLSDDAPPRRPTEGDCLRIHSEYKAAPPRPTQETEERNGNVP